ncbi:FUSC family protein [Kingella negevensis]|uniref:FUSC family protein n=1 Tax=Kingella negevensis TaxID=1522312 RepID=UPI00255165FC|nr:FUSC family protein [Kingella negevensis]MDK4706696.1 FUSC family protein [Kingella negevensis]MDK4708997.1 FUSC family protein [Kingella negevensis]
MKAIIQLWLTNWVTPYKRYQYQRNIHALRLAFCVVFAIGLGSYFHLKHSEWIAITVFVVLGTIPYQGSIASKSYERILGTMFGMIIGLTMLWLNQNYLRHNILFFILVGLVSLACGFKSLGKRGYAFMLMGLTMCMLLGHSEGDDWVNDGIMRAVNVVLGAAISLAASQLIPLKSTLMWRFTLADNLNDCAKQLASVTGQKVILPGQWMDLQEEQRKINSRLVKTRSLMAPTAVETHISSEVLESIQQNHRSIVSSVNIMFFNVPRLSKPRLSPDEDQLLQRHFFSLQEDLKQVSLMLKGNWQPEIHVNTDDEAAIHQLAVKLPFEVQGFVWTSLNIRAELAEMIDLLQTYKRKWLMKNEWQKLEE